MESILIHALAFPFAQVGRGLRWLSLSGGAGNVTAWVIYLAVCLSPFAVLALFSRKRESQPEDFLLAALGVLLFPVMYFMVNPGAMPGALRVFPPAVGFMLMGGAVWSLVLAYGVLRFIRRVAEAGEHNLLRYISALLYVLAVLFAVAVFDNLMKIPSALEAAPTGEDYVFILLRRAVQILPYLLNIWVAYAALRLLSSLRIGAYNEENINAAREMSRICMVTLVASVLAIVGFNLGQLLFSARLQNIHIELVFPLVPILLALGALLFARYMAQGKELKDENEGFV
jgi:hypothetical protein